MGLAQIFWSTFILGEFSQKSLKSKATNPSESAGSRQSAVGNHGPYYGTSVDTTSEELKPLGGDFLDASETSKRYHFTKTGCGNISVE